MRQATWSMVGENVERASGIAEVLEMADLNYEVEKVPVFLEDGTPVPNLCCTKKVGTDEIFGPVSSKYEVVQNMDAFQFVDSFVPEGMEFVKAGEAGNTVYIIARFPERYVLGDEVEPYLIFQNSHSLASAIRFTISPLRILCQNQFNWAFSNASNKVSIRHTLTASDRLIEARENLLQVNEYLNAFDKAAEELAAVSITAAGYNRIVESIFRPEDPESQRSIAAAQEKMALFHTAYNEDDNANFRGTAWGMVNAYSDYLTHRPMLKDTDTARANRFLDTTLGADSMSRFVSAIRDMA